MPSKSNVPAIYNINTNVVSGNNNRSSDTEMGWGCLGCLGLIGVFAFIGILAQIAEKSPTAFFVLLGGALMVIGMAVYGNYVTKRDSAKAREEAAKEKETAAREDIINRTVIYNKSWTVADPCVICGAKKSCTPRYKDSILYVSCATCYGLFTVNALLYGGMQDNI